jgi:hypothetical protein
MQEPRSYGGAQGHGYGEVRQPTRSLRNPSNLGPLHSGTPSLQGFREDYHGHGDEHDALDDEMDAEGSDDEVAQALQGQGQHMYHYAASNGLGHEHRDEIMMHHHHDGDREMRHPEGDEEMDEEEDEEEEEEDAAGEFSDSLSSSPSIPDDDIDFNLVYALHTFLATVDGQASVVKGDKLLLLDDSNSYWWLVRVLKTQAIGYIPAENIETPWERLARLNKHRNVDVSDRPYLFTSFSTLNPSKVFGGRTLTSAFWAQSTLTVDDGDSTRRLDGTVLFVRPDSLCRPDSSVRATAPARVPASLLERHPRLALAQGSPAQHFSSATA